jgi:hypothetical protein
MPATIPAEMQRENIGQIEAVRRFRNLDLVRGSLYVQEYAGCIGYRADAFHA